MFMGRQEHQVRGGGGGKQAILHSSIALLQERFRQLQKVKEMRQERELLMAFSKDSVLTQPTSVPHLDHQQQHPSCFIHPGLLYPEPTKPHHAVHSKATRPVWSVAGEHHQQSATAGSAGGYGGALPLGMGLLPNWAVATNTPVNYAEEKDVDTSLHL